MNINDFEIPNRHPYGMLAGMGLSHANEAETTLAYILRLCIEQGSFEPVPTTYSHPTLVEAGLLIDVDGKYQLTKKAKELLYSEFGVEK